jgi:hypothetical protein
MIKGTWNNQVKWASYVSQDFRLADAQFRDEALSEARLIMQAARKSIDKIIDRLITRRYEFVEMDFIHKSPSSLSDWLNELEGKG